MFMKLIMSNSKLFQRPHILLFVGGKLDRGLKHKPSIKNPLIKYNKQPLNYKYLSMDDMPVPSGSWKEHHAKKNKYYNRIFMFGIASLVISISILRKTVLFNALPPPYPFDEVPCEDEDKECEVESENENEHKCVCAC